nr:hypothetical protein [uncultured Desulfobulbus sp.]
MKKVLLTGAALMLVGGMVATEASYAAEPGVKITGDARVRLWYKNDAYDFDNSNAVDDDVSMDSRVRLNIKGTAAGGAYAAVRIRMYESLMGDIDKDPTPIDNANNIWVDKAYVGIPFNDAFTLEIGKYRSTYGPLGPTYNFFYDDVHSTGFKGIIKLDNVEINPFIEWMEEAQYDEVTTSDKNADNDEIRFGAHVKAKLNKDWTLGGMLGYQTDSRNGVAGSFEPNEGFFASIYTKGQSGQFGLVGELAVTDGDLNGFNSWLNDGSGTVTYSVNKTTGAIVASTDTDQIGSDDTGFGGYLFPNYQIDKLNIGLNLGFTTGGFMPDRAFGFVMIGSSDNSKITDYIVGAGGDWLWAGLVATYQVAEDLKLTGNLVYADIDAWSNAGDGPLGGQMGMKTLDSAWELSAVLQYTISKGADVYFSAGMLAPDMEYAGAADDTAFGALTRFELKF